METSLFNIYWPGVNSTKTLLLIEDDISNICLGERRYYYPICLWTRADWDTQFQPWEVASAEAFDSIVRNVSLALGSFVLVINIVGFTYITIIYGLTRSTKCREV